MLRFSIIPLSMRAYVIFSKRLSDFWAGGWQKVVFFSTFKERFQVVWRKDKGEKGRKVKVIQVDRK